MNNLQVQLISAVLSWSSKNHQIPKKVLHEDNNWSCNGSISNSQIVIEIENLCCRVNRSDKYGVVSDPHNQCIHANCSNGARIQCNLDSSNHIMSTCGLDNVPSGEISISISGDKVTTSHYGSSQTFIMEI